MLNLNLYSETVLHKTMFELSKLLLPSLWLILPLLLILMINKFFSFQNRKACQSTNTTFPKSYPIIGHLIAIYQHKDERFQWFSSLLLNSPTGTIVIHHPFGWRSIETSNPANVEHMLKAQFPIYQKGPYQKSILKDLLGNGIFNVDGDMWKFQREIASYEFNTKSLRNFVETVVDTELSGRLIPILQEAARNQTVLDLQDMLKRFAFDNICKIAFGYDPEYLSPALPQAKFADAFEDAVMISGQRARSYWSMLWKVRRLLSIGSEKRLKEAVDEIRGFAISIVRQKKQAMLLKTQEFSSSEPEDLLSRFLKSGHYDEKFVSDIVISFILAGRDTTSAALTWFFWMIHKNKHVEEEILSEINKGKGKQEIKTENSSVFEQVKDMVYTHAALCESMRLYPPVPVEAKEAAANDVLPDGTHVKKGMWVVYIPYVMGRMESIWGTDWAEYKPERWLELEDAEKTGKEKWKFVPKDPYSYPVFQAGPRVCLGKEMAFLQMKRVVAGILERFRVVPAVEEGFEPVYLPHLTSEMQGGLPVRIQERIV
ncbi:cytochrome P450 94A2-like [Chenopodium quinoa]|uniref:cytochrome P450 94A2-like n=1 Tax=Chenopodium quinoa TaxID=63459 RepID=UPI000B770BA8|nr:cytochrome P450 94A2-like [Chenopodium quinoa]